ncbi:hypothetical protein AAG570_005376 [Ranatra chinensis]|uniref:Dynein heavy chain AAA 5 extension domain-containing protein n=1 Tax=Ranatra chinensis TaxID=642074 RepID=A0ABD0Y150_9HEMI
MRLHRLVESKDLENTEWALPAVSFSLFFNHVSALTLQLTLLKMVSRLQNRSGFEKSSDFKEWAHLLITKREDAECIVGIGAQVTQLCFMLDSTVQQLEPREAPGGEAADEEDYIRSDETECLFLQALYCSLGASLLPSGKVAFDSFIKKTAGFMTVDDSVEKRATYHPGIPPNATAWDWSMGMGIKAQTHSFQTARSQSKTAAVYTLTHTSAKKKNFCFDLPFINNRLKADVEFTVT